MKDELSAEERRQLLRLAREAIGTALSGRPLERLDLEALPERLRLPGVTFVTLTHQGKLRGCVGALEAYQPLADDVREHAVAAAIQDFRFEPVAVKELPELEIEVSRLTAPQDFPYDCPEELLAGLRPGVDGVVLQDGSRRATFLPQVWKKLPEPELFLSYLCEKMGSDPCLWQRRKLQVAIYQVEEIQEGLEPG